MHYAIYCLDKPNAGELRSGALPAHRDFVDGRAACIRMSGPLLAHDGATRIGQLYVIEAADESTARAFIDNDPFTAAGLFESVVIHRFAAKFMQGRREMA